MRKTNAILILTGVLAVVGARAAWAGTEFEDPVRLKAGETPIDCEVGHAAPYAYDWDGDGVWDLLVGQMGQGRLLVYRNVGTATEPRFEGSIVFQAGDGDGTVPSG